MTVAGLVRKNIVALRTEDGIEAVPDAVIETAARLMRRQAIGALPVVVNDVCIGLVTRADVIDHLTRPTTGSRVAGSDGERDRLLLRGILEELHASRHGITVEAI
jgi:CBS domain-containing protein